MFTIEDVPIRRWGWVVKYGQVPKLGGQVWSSAHRVVIKCPSWVVKYGQVPKLGGQVWSSLIKCPTSDGLMTDQVPNVTSEQVWPT